MSITAEWLLEQDQMNDFALIAGDTSLNIPITGINIMDNPEAFPWLTKGAFILSTGYFYTDSQIADSIVKTLVDKGSSGLGIKMNRFIKELPASMIEQADKYHFPIFSIPFTCSMDQISNLVYHKMYEDEMSAIYNSSVLYHDIAECVLHTAKLSKILSLISSTTNANAFFTDSMFEILEYKLLPDFQYSYPFPFSTGETTLFSDSIIKKIQFEIETNSSPMLEHVEENTEGIFSFKIYPLINRKNILGYLVLLNEPDTQSSYNAIMNIQSMLCIAFMHQNMLSETERSSRDIFFQNLLGGKLHELQDVESACIQNEFNFTSQRICFVIHIPEYETFTIAKRRAYERKIYSYIEEILPNRLHSLQITVFQTRFVLFISFKDEYGQPIASRIGQMLSLKIIASLYSQGITCRIGFSKASSGADTILTCYRQALEAVDTGYKFHDNKQIFSYYIDQIYYILLKHFTNHDLQELYNETLGILEKYDLKTQSELTNTLKAYIDCQQNITKTAKQLFIHRNTMFYRLDQIRELIHVDFDSKDDIYKLQTAFYIKDILNKI